VLDLNKLMSGRVQRLLRLSVRKESAQKEVAQETAQPGAQEEGDTETDRSSETLEQLSEDEKEGNVTLEKASEQEEDSGGETPPQAPTDEVGNNPDEEDSHD